MSGFSWRGGTKPRRSEVDDNREQSDEPPAEWLEKRAENEEESDS